MPRRKAPNVAGLGRITSDERAHSGITKREFLRKTGQCAVAGATAAVSLESLKPNRAQAQQATADTPSVDKLCTDNGTIITGPTQELGDALKDVPDGSGFRVVNFLKFHSVAAYPADYQGASVTGAEAYWNIYIAGMAPIVSAAGAGLVMRAKAFGTIAGLAGEEWDEVAIFEWPNVETMQDLMQHPRFLELSIHRIAATKNLRMVPMTVT